jgi:P27 family predicted phage terminase small subunit
MDETMAGRPAKPTEQKRKTGNPGKRKLPDLKNVISLPPIKGDAPLHLSDAGQKMWADVKAMAPWIANTDGKLLIELCEKMDKKYELKEKLAATDYVLFTDKGYAYANPLFGMLNTVENDIVKLLSLLGLTPVDRSKLGVAEVTTKGKLAQLLEQQKKNG